MVSPCCRSGQCAAQYNLGISYARGAGVPQDNVVAHMWFNLAAARFTSPVSRGRAVGNRDAVARKMSPEEIARAQALAHEWEAHETAAVLNADGAVVSPCEPQGHDRLRHRANGFHRLRREGLSGGQVGGHGDSDQPPARRRQ